MLEKYLQLCAVALAWCRRMCRVTWPSCAPPLSLEEIWRNASACGSRNRWKRFDRKIYNFAELRAKLEAEGVQFHSQSDTEVILRLYEREGDACVERLRSKYAPIVSRTS